MPSTSPGARSPTIATACQARALAAYLHLGLYAYRRDFLLGLAPLPPSPLEPAEKLEQLRVLEAGYPIAVGIVDEPSIGIDTPDDYRRFVERCAPGVERRSGAQGRGPGRFLIPTPLMRSEILRREGNIDHRSL